MKFDVLYEMKSFQNDIMRKSCERKGLPERRTVSPVQMRIMDYLFENTDKDIYQKDLEILLNVRKSTLSGILDTMEKNQIIKRIDSETDLRSKKIVLTDEAMRRKKEIAQYFEKVNETVTKDIPEEKLEVFFEVIEMMKKNIKNEYK